MPITFTEDDFAEAKPVFTEDDFAGVDNPSVIQSGESFPGLEPFTNGRIPFKPTNELTYEEAQGLPPALREGAIKERQARLSTPTEPDWLNKALLFAGEQGPAMLPTGSNIINTPARIANAVAGKPVVADFEGVNMRGLIQEPLQMIEELAAPLGLPSGALTSENSPVAGIAKGTEEVATGFTHPDVLLTLPAFGTGIPATVSGIATLARGKMAFDAIRSIPEAVQHSINTSLNPNSTVADVFKAATQAGVSVAIAKLMAEAVTPKPGASNAIQVGKTETLPLDARTRVSPQVEPQVRQQATTQTEVSPPSIEPVRSEVTPEITQFGQDFAAGKRISTEAAVGAGLKAKSIADLDALAELQAKARQELVEARAKIKSAKTPSEQETAMNQAMIKGTAVQLPREAIEGAVNAGSNKEGGSIKFGERPLDWNKNPEVADWLRKNGENIGIHLPEELKAAAPKPGETAAKSEADSEIIGMGGAKLGETSKEPQLKQLSASLETLASTGKKPELRRAYTLSEHASQWKDSASKSLDALKGVAYYAKEKLRGMPKWDSFKSALGQRQLALSESALNARDFADKAQRAVPKAIDREAIANWIDTGGDAAKLNEALIATKEQYKKGYEKALNITPEDRVVAQNIQNYFESRLKDAQEAGILEDGLEDYIHRIYEKESPWKQGVLAELRSGVFTGNPALAKQRTFQYDYEAEQAGYKPIKDFAKRVAAYDLSLNKAIADRQFVKEAMQWKMPDGRPAIDAAGVGIPIEGAEADAGPLLIKPQFKPSDTTNPKNNRSDYVALDHPSLRKWKWVGEGKEGEPVLIQGNVLVHPDALPQIKAVFGKSRVRENIVGRAALGLGATVKQTMLDLSGFHPVQITVHGWEHRTFKPIKEIDLQDPVQRDLVSHGLVAADPRGLELFGEGLTGSSLTRHIPGLGPKLQAYNEWLFQDYIPRLKMAMAKHALERNRERFKSDLESGKMTEDQLLHLTAMQGNAAFGELNYEMMARNKTTQDMLRLALLAPDFLEARGRFAGQAFTKYGKEQRTALLLGAATLYITARIMNKMLDDQYHFEPKNAFSIVHNKHAYSLRTVQGDLLHMITDPARFAYNRLSPVYGRTGLEAITGRDAFGRKRSGLEQVQDLAKTIVPISLRGVVNPREQKLWESFLNSIGITERRETATDDIFKLAQDFKKQIGSTEPGEFIYDPESDPYRSIKVAIAYDTPQTAAQEMLNAIRDGKTDFNKLSGFVDRYANMPFTGSKKNDKLFISQLSEDEKKTYQRALAERQKMRTNMRQAFIILKNNRP